VQTLKQRERDVFERIRLLFIVAAKCTVSQRIDGDVPLDAFSC